MNKKLILGSVPSVMFLLTMFVSSTFAWFTDFAVNQGNRVQSGNLVVGFTASDQLNEDNSNLGGNIQDLKVSIDPVFNLGNAAQPGDSQEKYLRIRNEGNIAINYQVDFIVTIDSKLAEVILFDIQPLGGTTQTVAGTVIDSGVYISLRDTNPDTGGLLRPSPEVPQEYEIWRVKMTYSPEAGNEYNDASLEFEVDIQLTAWQFNYAESGGGSFGGGGTSTDPYAAYRQIYNDYLIENPEYEGDIVQFIQDLISGNLADKDVFTVTFDSNGGSAVASQQVIDGNKVTRPNNPTRLNYTFEGWFINGLEQWVFGAFTVTEDLTLVARWRSIETTTYDIFYVLGYDNLIIIDTVEYGEMITVPSPSRTGYTFNGWFDANDVQYTGGVYQLTKNYVVYARWTPITYTITLNTNGGTISGSTTRSVTFGSNFSLPVPTTEANNFTGWFNGNDKITDKFGASLAPWSLTSNVTLNALYFIEVSSAQQLSDIRNDLSASYALTQDISLTGEWTPIGNASAAFSGLFDGNGFTISNLTVTATQSYVGLFGYSTGVIRGLKLANVTIDVSGPIDGPIYAGAVVGYSTGTLRSIETLSGSVASRARAANTGYVGGIVGAHFNNYRTYSDMINRVSVSGIANSIGGVLGYSNASLIISNSTNHGNIQGSNYVGGLVGNFYGYSSANNNLLNFGSVVGSNYVGGIFGRSGSYTNISSAINHGSVTGSGYAVGGIVGEQGYGSILNSLNNGNVLNLLTTFENYSFTANGNNNHSSYTGGIVGNMYGTHLDNLENNGQIIGEFYVGGIFGYGSGLHTNLINSGVVYGARYVGGVGGTRSSFNATNTSFLINHGNVNVINKNTDLIWTYPYGESESIGGIFGSSYSTIISNSVNHGEFIFTNVRIISNLGGLVGYMDGGSIINSYNSVDIDASLGVSQVSRYVGGLIGYGSQISFGYVYNSGSIKAREFVGGIVGFANQNSSMFVYYAINFGDVTATIATTNVGSILGSAVPTNYDFERIYHTNTNTANGVVVDGIAFGTKVTELSLLDLDFFTTMLEWSTDTWSFEGLDIANGVYPVLRFTLPEEEQA
jgi:uncharacterized repeat protein (TIGR02543 family)